MKEILSKFKYNIILAVAITSTFVITEQLFRIYNDLLTFNLSIKIFLEQFLINLIIISVVSRKAILIAYSILVLFVWFQLVHFSYYGTWIFPLEYILFFSQFQETYKTFVSITHIAIIPTLITMFILINIYYLVNKFERNRVKIPFLSFFIILVLVFLPLRIYLKDDYRKNNKPNFEHYPIKNTIMTLSNLFGNIIPKKISGVSGLEQKIKKTPEIILNNPDVNVILIMGESLNRNFMSLYDYKINTTPFLDTLKSKDNFIYKNAIAGGVYTDVSIPNFFNMVEKPDGIPQILSTNTCLFKMAKENGFDTYFYSSQAQEELKGIKNYLCNNWIDELEDGTEITKDKNKSALDINLLGMLDKVDFNKPSFVTLHQRGSHTPFIKTFPEEFEVFTKKNIGDNSIIQNTLDYLNSIRYSDHVLENIIKEVEKKTTRETYIIFTSDHSTSVGDSNINGHGSLVHDSIYQVPFFMLILNSKKNIKEDFSDFPYISHYQISNLISNLLGYKKTYQYFNKKEDFFVCGSDISGLSGVLNISFDDNNNLVRGK